MSRFIALYGTQAQCEAELEKCRWRDGFVCPICARKEHYIVWHGKAKTFQCHACRHQTTPPDGRPLYAMFSKIQTFGREDVKAWAIAHLTAASVVISNGLDCFTAVKAVGARHELLVVGTSRKSSSMPCFKWINTILGNLKTATSGTYHAFDFDKYGFLYLAEAQYRFNRRFDLSTILLRLVHAAVTTGRRTEAWLRLAEDER